MGWEGRIPTLAATNQGVKEEKEERVVGLVLWGPKK